MDSIVKKIALAFGTIGSLVIIGTYIYIWKEKQYLNGSLTVITLLFPLVMAFGAQILSKVKLDGYISMKQGVMAFAITIGLIFLLEALTNYSIFVHIDPTAQDAVLEAQKARQAELEAKGGAVRDFIKVDYSFAGYAIATATKFLMYTVLGMIMALVLRKKLPINS